MPNIELMDVVEERARRQNDGHLTLLRFTTGWKAMFGTPDLDTGAGRTQVNALVMYPTLLEALLALLVEP